METVTVVEDGVVVSKTVNGEPAALEGGTGTRHSAVEGSRSKGKKRKILYTVGSFSFKLYLISTPIP